MRLRWSLGLMLPTVWVAAFACPRAWNWDGSLCRAELGLWKRRDEESESLERFRRP